MLLALTTNQSSKSFVAKENNLNDDNEEEKKIASPNDHITVKIGNEEKEFSVVELEQLPYFEAILSSRWKKLEGRNKINIFGDENNEIESGNNPFNCEHLQLLLHIGKSNHIPFNLSNYMKQMDGLLYCSDFFAIDNKNKFFIGKDKIMDFLRNQRPCITYNQRKEWMFECKHSRLKEALFEYNEYLKDEATRVHCDTMKNKINSSYDLNGGDNININSDLNAAAKILDNKSLMTMFRRQFKLLIIRNIDMSNKKSIRWKLQGLKADCGNTFRAKLRTFNCQEFWGCCTNLLNEIIVASSEITIYDSVSIEKHEYQAIRCLLDVAIKNHSNELAMAIGITRFELIKAEYKLTHACHQGFFYRKIYQRYYIEYQMEKLTPKEKEKMLLMHVCVKDIYLVLSDNGSPNIENEKKGAEGWAMLFITILPMCCTQFLVNNANLWFPIIHQDIVHNKETVVNQLIKNEFEWISINILNKLSSKQSFDMAMYLVDYSVYQKQKDMALLSSQLIKFIQHHTGISWDIIHGSKPSSKGCIDN